MEINGQTRQPAEQTGRALKFTKEITAYKPQFHLSHQSPRKQYMKENYIKQLESVSGTNGEKVPASVEIRRDTICFSC